MKEDKEFDYINVIPLVDVMLVLFTIVLTTSTFIATGMISISLPKASQARNEAIIKQQTITIDKSGIIYFNTSPVLLEDLGTALHKLDRETPILVRADSYIRLQAFIDVLDLLNSHGFQKVAVQTEKKR
jgi:biopolymer transport protein ExbD